MKTYICHKEVRAERIKSINIFDSDGSCEIALITGKNREYTKDIYARYEPVEGDYLVQYESGYTSVSPKDVFEKGYSLKEELTGCGSASASGVSGAVVGGYNQPNKVDIYFLASAWEREYTRYANNRGCTGAIESANEMIDALKEKLDKE